MRKNIKIWRPDLCNISENAIIGDDVIIHPFSSIYQDVKIGNNVKIQNGCFLPNGIEIENNVFLSPFVKFANDSRPPSNGKCWKKTIVKDGAVIGINATILPGVIIGKNSFVGANSLVTKDIPDDECWIGSPARFYKKRKDL